MLWRIQFYSDKQHAKPSGSVEFDSLSEARQAADYAEQQNRYFEVLIVPGKELWAARTKT